MNSDLHAIDYQRSPEDFQKIFRRYSEDTYNLCAERHQSGIGFNDDDPDNCATSMQQSTVLESEYSDFRLSSLRNRVRQYYDCRQTTSAQVSLQRRGEGYPKYILYVRNVSL